MTKDIAIKVENLTKVYKLYDSPADRLKEAMHWKGKKYHKDFYALNDISLEIQKGETVGIIGKNGSGKSTLLKIITGVLTPTTGTVTVNGRVSALLELGAGFNPEYTGLENIYFQGNLMGYSRNDMEAKVQAIVEFADIGDFIHQPVKMYSSGMFARLAFAVAINVEPDILIVDEALSVGDMVFQAKCFSRFKQLRESGVTILFVTHSVDTVIKYCHSAILLHEGKKIADGTSKETVECFRKLMVNLTTDRNLNLDKDSEASSNLDELIKQYNLKSYLPLNPKADVYGNNEAQIIDYAIINEDKKITNQIYHDEKYTVLLSVRFNADIIDPIFAFTIKSVDGLELTGTNSLCLQQIFGLVRSGEIITVKFTQTMILNAGKYLLALGCTKYQDGELYVFNRIYDAVVIDVVSTNLGTGIAFAVTEMNVDRKVMF